MNRNKLKKYAPQARRDFIKAVTDRAAFYGLSEKHNEPISEQGDMAIIAGKPFPRSVAAKRKRLEERIRRDGFDQVMEAMAYTWFNRFVAIRYMELHGYLDHGYRVLSTASNTNNTIDIPDILKYAEHVELPDLDREKVIELKLAGDKDEELYRMLLIAQCNALRKAMPFLFEKVAHETELLLPENLLHSDSLIRKLVNEVPEEEWGEVEIIGWLYQFYISEKKDQVIGKVVKSEDIPAATQLFTPNWIVKYMVQNTLGRQWMATYPNSPLKAKMDYYIEPAEQTPEVQEQLKAMTPESLNPEDLTLLDPACGSGHILAEAYDLLKAIYQERGYRARDIPRLILEKNLYGLEIDDRAAQLAAFALMMKGRADDRRVFDNGTRPHVLAIQETKGMDAEKITEALNAPILKGDPPPCEMLFEEMDEARAPLLSRKNLAVKGDISRADVAQLIWLFEHAKTFGSLIRVQEGLAEKLPTIAERVADVLAYGNLFGKNAAEAFTPIMMQARMLAKKYDAVVTNPPYMGSGYFNNSLKKGLKKNHNIKRTDLYAIFVERFLLLCKTLGMITRQDWMFTKSYTLFRQGILTKNTILTLAQLGASAFKYLSGEVVQTCAFCLMSNHVSRYEQSFFSLTDGGSQEKSVALRNRLNQFVLSADEFSKIPTSPIVYWITDSERSAFGGSPLENKATLREGIHTGRNELYLRSWWEVPYQEFSASESSYESIERHSVKWIPYNKGGSSRRWYGANEFVIAFDRQSRDEMSNLSGHVRPSQSLYFLTGGTWSDVGTRGFGVRFYPKGFLFDGSGPVVIAENIMYIIGLMNSKPFRHMAQIVMPNLHYKCGTVKLLPYTECRAKHQIEQLSEEAITLAREDWDSFEESWDYLTNPLLREQSKQFTIEETYRAWENKQAHRRTQLLRLEESINHAFIEEYGLNRAMTPTVSDEELTLFHLNREEDIKRLTSYAVGCMMGRYSLDAPGLIYAHSGNDQFWKIYHERHDKPAPEQNNSYHSCGSWSSFPPDEDGIIPITDTDWFEDDAANRITEFISVAWTKEHLEDNLKFMADSLGPKKGESPRDTIRRYLTTGFYKHHMKIYKKRPIYWLFASGKQRAFQCLVYLHRYNKATLSRMRTEYVIPLQGKINARIDQLKEDAEAASSTPHRKKVERERDKLIKQQAELQAFDEKLRHYADQRISLDLDDGVKVNYGKFGDLLAEVNAVTGKKKKMIQG